MIGTNIKGYKVFTDSYNNQSLFAYLSMFWKQVITKFALLHIINKNIVIICVCMFGRNVKGYKVLSASYNTEALFKYMGVCLRQLL